MGLRYSIDLYFHIEDIENALVATSKFANVFAGEQTLFALPNGQTIAVPFDSNYDEEEPVELASIGRGSLKTALMFVADDAILNYIDAEFPAEDRRNGLGNHPIGVIYLQILCEKHYTRFAFQAATSSMSRLFLESSSIQKRFLAMLHAVGGVLGLINIESWEYLLLENSDLIISDDRHYLMEGLFPNIDEFATRMIAVKTYEQSRWQTINERVIFYHKWITCFKQYLLLETFIDAWKYRSQARPTDQRDLIALFTSRMAEVTDEILNIMLSEQNWLSRCVASCLIAFGKRNDYEGLVGTLLLQYPHYAEAFCLVLVRLNHIEGVGMLEQYLNKYLPLQNTNPNEREALSVDWAMAALNLLDATNGTTKANSYLASDGLWTRFVEDGFEDFAEGEERPNWRYERLKYWLARWDLEQATIRLRSALDFAEKHFDLNRV